MSGVVILLLIIGILLVEGIEFREKLVRPSAAFPAEAGAGAHEHP